MIRLSRSILLLAAVAVVPLLCGCGPTPQLGSSPEALVAADQLFTAVTAKRTELVDASAKNLAQLKEAGKLPPDAATALDAIVEQARAGQWDTARDDLRAFIGGQRRTK